MRLSKEIGIIFLCIFMASCSYLPQTASQVDQRSIYVWPVKQCPSEPTEKIAPVIAAIGSILASNLVSGFVSIPATALTAAADADKNGFNAMGINPIFYYTGANNNQLTPPACYVLAYTKPADQPKSWCDNAEFKSSLTSTCQNGVSLLDNIQKETKPVHIPLEVPDFYAEIKLEKSNYDNIVLPRVVALYYPKSLLQPESNKPRTISINLTMNSPTKENELKNTQIALTLSGITPGANTSATNLYASQASWASRPVIKPTKDDPKIIEGNPYLPVTIVATLHEIGEPNVFLAAFAKAFSSSTNEYTKTITNAVVPAK